MATKKSSKKGLASASKKTRTKVANKGRSQEKNKQCREKKKEEKYQLGYDNKDRKTKLVTKIFFLLFCIIP